MFLFSLASSTRKNGDPQKRNLALFAGSFGVLAIATIVMWLVAPHQPMHVTLPRPASKDFYLAFDGPISLDDRVLYQGEYDTTRYLKAADVLLLGNSRLMFGFPQYPFRQLFERFNMTYYMLGFGHAECDLFPLQIIRKFDLHPKLVIVNADNFFVGGQSVFSARITRESQFESRKQLFEGEATYFARHNLHKIMPHWLYLSEGRWELVVHRSVRDGAWWAPDNLPYTFPVPDGPGVSVPPMRPHYLELARQFKAEMEQRGARLILTFFPSQYGNREFAEQFARHLNVPLVSPRLEGLETFDLSHLNPKSARRFTAAFIAELAEVLQPAPASSPTGMPRSGPNAQVEADVARSNRETTVR